MARKDATLAEREFQDAAKLTDSTGGTTDGTLEAVPSDTLVNNAAAVNNNFAELNAKLDFVIDRLKQA